MDASKQQVVGFFIEEARENLDTIEQGLLNLQDTMGDAEQINAVFRAAHSVKGGAAMLGFNSIQKVAHRLEDCFKVLKEQPTIAVDRQVESMFLRGFDTLQELLEQLQGPFGLQDEEAEHTVRQVEPIFQELQAYLKQLSGGGTGGVATDFSAQCTNSLRSMLQLFKQPESAQGRAKLQAICSRLADLGGETESWKQITALAERAVGNPKAPYKILAPILIKELKGGIDLVQSGQANALRPSANLQKLAAAAPAPAVAAPQPTPVTAAPAANEITLPLEPKAAAQALAKAFERKQLVELANLLIRIIKGQ